VTTGVGAGVGVATTTGVDVLPDDALLPQPGAKTATAHDNAQPDHVRIFMSYTTFSLVLPKGPS